MSEELYNSNDFCKLAEEFEELKKENAELSRDKDRLMNLFMERSEYVFSVVSNMKINDLERKCKALEADYIISNREMLIMQVELGRLRTELARKDEELGLTEKKLCNIDRSARAEIARRDEIISRLKEDAERLASGYEQVSREIVPYCVVCKKDAFSGYLGQIKHDDWCPVTIHRALMKELEG